MKLHLLFRTTCLTAHYDLANDWLYLDWEGDLTLPVVQEACLALASCYLRRPYSHVLNSNEQVTSVSWSVAMWLATDFLPYMTLAGIEHVAWVAAPSLWGHNLVHKVLSLLPGSPLTTFDDVADAVTWLQHTRTGQDTRYLLPMRAPATQARLVQEVQALQQRLAMPRRRQQAA